MLQDLPKWERPREKLSALGVKSLSNAELVAILISSGTVEESAISLASKVLSLEPDGISKFSGYEPEEFMTIKGIGRAKACSLVAAIELGRRIQSFPCANRLDVNDSTSFSNIFVEEMRYLSKETVRVVMLDCHSRIIGKSDVSVGGLVDASAHPREIFAGAIKKAAAAIIVAHNHPSGDSTPSRGDKVVTQQLANSGKLLGIELVDHIIVGDGDYTSMKELFPELF